MCLPGPYSGFATVYKILNKVFEPKVLKKKILNKETFDDKLIALKVN